MKKGLNKLKAELNEERIKQIESGIKKSKELNKLKGELIEERIIQIESGIKKRKD